MTTEDKSIINYDIVWRIVEYAKEYPETARKLLQLSNGYGVDFILCEENSQDLNISDTDTDTDILEEGHGFYVFIGLYPTERGRYWHEQETSLTSYRSSLIKKALTIFLQESGE